jgi:S-adenosylmethionine synthetase
MSSDFVFTSESVSRGHPDKVCDQLSDALVAAFLVQDTDATVAAECAVSTSIVFVSVKAASDAAVDVPNAVRTELVRIGYDFGQFDAKTCTVMSSLNQTPNGSRARTDGDIVATEPVTVFGYACDHTPALMPAPIVFAHRVARTYDEVRRGELDYLCPDAKVQVGVFFEAHRPKRIHSVTVVASQRNGAVHLRRLRDDVRAQIIEPSFQGAVPSLDANTRIAVNPEGTIIEGGPALHAGLTGRKNGVDSYGEFSRQSGAALSGKDPSRIDRIGAYSARWAAKNVVAADLAQRCEIQLSYSIGVPEPVSIRVETFGTGREADDRLLERVRRTFDFRPGAILRAFDLRTLFSQPDGPCRRLGAYGHVGRTDLDLPWEVTDRIDALRD